MPEKQAELMGSQIAAIVVNFNGQTYLHRCLEAIFAADHVPATVIVVDNASTDGSADLLESNFPQVKLLRQAENIGFAAANNRGVTEAKKSCEGLEWLALINPDAFVERDWLVKLVPYLTDQTGMDFISCQLLSDKNTNILDGAGDCYHVSGLIWRRSHGAKVRAQSSLPFFSPCAAAALYRLRAFSAVGGFDERYFCYSEDVDLGFRLRLAGYQGVHVPESQVRHVGSGITQKESDFSIYYGHRNLVWTYFKNMPTTLLWVYLPQHLLMNVLSIVYYLAKGRFVILKAKWDAFKGLPKIIGQRHSVADSKIVAQRLKPFLANGWLTPYFRRNK